VAIKNMHNNFVIQHDSHAKNKHLAYRDRACITALEDFLEAEVKKRACGI
jgi:hypothetical protein